MVYQCLSYFYRHFPYQTCNFEGYTIPVHGPLLEPIDCMPFWNLFRSWNPQDPHLWPDLANATGGRDTDWTRWPTSHLEFGLDQLLCPFQELGIWVFIIIEYYRYIPDFGNTSLVELFIFKALKISQCSDEPWNRIRSVCWRGHSSSWQFGRPWAGGQFRPLFWVVQRRGVLHNF